MAKKDDSVSAPSTRLTCDGCPGHCCRYAAVEIDAPETEDDYDTIRWYIAHDMWVFFEDDTWYLYIRNPCRYLDADNRCSIYEFRMQICRDHSSEDCERWNVWEPDLLFKTVLDWEKYADKALKARAQNASSSKRQSGRRKKRHRTMRWLIDGPQ